MSQLVAITLCLIVLIFVTTFCMMLLNQAKSSSQLWLMKQIAKENENFSKEVERNLRALD